jgi:hypothetical protein
MESSELEIDYSIDRPRTKRKRRNGRSSLPFLQSNESEEELPPKERRHYQKISKNSPFLNLFILLFTLIGWDLHYAALVKYGKQYGTCNVPSPAVYTCTIEGMTDDGGVYNYEGNLGKWVEYQRSLYKARSKGDIVTESHLALLQELVDQGMQTRFRISTGRISLY